VALDLAQDVAQDVDQGEEGEEDEVVVEAGEGVEGGKSLLRTCSSSRIRSISGNTTSFRKKRGPGPRRASTGSVRTRNGGPNASSRGTSKGRN